MFKSVFINNQKNLSMGGGIEKHIRQSIQVLFLTLFIISMIPAGSAQGKSSEDKKQNVPSKSLNPQNMKSQDGKDQSKSKKKKKSCASMSWISPKTLPQATLGTWYSYQFKISGGHAPVAYSADKVKKDSIPDGLFLAAGGLLSGYPQNSGSHSFTVFACDSCQTGPRCIQKKFTLKVKVKGNTRAINSRVSPSTMIVRPGKLYKRKVTHIFEDQTPQSPAGALPGPIRFDSWIGEFSVHGKILGQVKSHLKAEGQTAFKVEEDLSIPQSVIDKAKKLKTTQFVYKRTFDSKEPQIQKETKIILKLIAKGPSDSTTVRSSKRDLKVIRLRVYFENKGFDVRVEKNQKLPRLIASIEYTGSGVLSGYWESGGKRIPVNEQIPFGRRIYIQYPDEKNHLTEKIGKHRIRFVITSPVKAPSSRWAEYTVITMEAARYVENQIVVSTGPDKKKRLIGYLRKKYRLKIVDSFEVKTLKRQITVYRTKKNIFQLIKQIKKEKGVISAQPNTIFKTLAEPKSNLQGISKSLNFQKLHTLKKGRGVVVAILDTGVDIKHRDFKNKNILYKNLVKGGLNRAEIHGTAVAGIIGASINNFGIEGIAPESKLLALRTCVQISRKYPEGQGDSTSIVKGIDISIQKKAKIVNMSFGAPVPDPLIQLMLREGDRRGIIFVAPVGNQKGQKKPNFPASSPSVLAVGGVNMKNRPYPDKHLASKAKVCAPAVNIFTTIPNNKHNFMTGTSMSSAIVAGILALAVENNRKLHLDDLPQFKGDTCQWTEQVLKMDLCK